jgi:hypothetical protein
VFAKNAEHDESLEVSRHARGLSVGVLVGIDILDDPGYDRIASRLKRLERGVAGELLMDRLNFMLYLSQVLIMSDVPPLQTLRRWLLSSLFCSIMQMID